MTATKSKSDLIAEAKAMEAVEHCVGHNEGTYGAMECCRKTGSGDHRYGNRHEYETVGGAKRATGPDKADMPGRMRYYRDALNADRKRLAEIRRQISSM